jgi:signal transduction histidine kinase/CheY-like chemotaxis protein
VSDSDRVDDVLEHVAAMANPQRRRAAAQALAARTGARDLIVFVPDAEVGTSLPALGFPQTLPGGRAWRDLVDRAIATGDAEGSVPSPDGSACAARAVGLADGTVIVLHGDTRPDADLSVLRTLLPLLGGLFRMESIARRAEAEAALARRSVADASELTSKLDKTRAELQRALTAAETAARARDEFLATVSHELRTPLTSIIGWIQLLRDERDPAVIGEGLETIDRNARAQSRLIEDILDFSRINAGKLRLDVRPVDLSDVIRAAIEIVRPAADARSVKLDSVLNPNALISGDPDRLQQVVWNLLSNAVKFTPRSGRVQVRLERIDSHAELTVSDTGDGISPEFLPHVFDRFSQADSTSTRKHGGLGLGLGIVRHLVELHGGTVEAYSQGLGKGATFAVRLPLLVAHQQEPALELQLVAEESSRSAGSPSANDLTGVSVLIVEDNEDARTLLTTILQRSGAFVAAVSGVSDAMKRMTIEQPDIIVSDIEMPGEDGYSLIHKVRRRQPLSQIPAIALTAYARSVDRVRALEAGFQMHIAKPVDPAELVAAVKTLVATTRPNGTPSSS